jgi:hypothetical protein
MAEDRPAYPLRELMRVVLTAVWGTCWRSVQRVARLLRRRQA